MCSSDLEIRGAVGEIGDQRLVVMAALTIADELFEARRIIAELREHDSERADIHGAVRREADEWAASIVDALGDASRRIEDLASALAGPTKS